MNPTYLPITDDPLEWQGAQSDQYLVRDVADVVAAYAADSDDGDGLDFGDWLTHNGIEWW
jgi:hypothetical protein